jgi:chromosome segregation ATPase
MSAEGTSSEGEGKKGNEGSPDLAAITKRLEDLEGTNKRLLDESKEAKRKAQEAQKALEDAEKEREVKAGDLKAQLERERKEKEALMKDNKSIKGKTLRENIKAALKEHAKDAHDIDLLMNQPKYKDYLERAVDGEELSVNSDAIKEYVAKVREATPFLFKTLSQANVDNTRANGGKGGEKKDYSKMSSKEIIEDIKKNHK